MYIYDQNISGLPLKEGGAMETSPPVPLKQRPGDTLPYREAMEETERKQYEEYQRDCAGRRILETLELGSLAPLERVRSLERKLAGIPHLFEHYHQLRALLRRREITPVRFERLRRGLLIAHGFPPQYALSTQDSELANARCELSKTRWEFMVTMRTGRVPGRLPQR